MRVASILKMAEITIERIKSTDNKFVTLITKDYYEVIRELISAILILDGYKAEGSNAHKTQIEYLSVKYSNEFKKHEIVIMDDLRIKRNKIAYEGFFVPEDYITQRIKEIQAIIDKLKDIINKKFKN